MTVHLHIATTSRDCDGTYDRSSIEVRRITALDIPSTYDNSSGSYTLTIEDGVDDDELLYHMTASVPTDEGHIYTELTECDRDCNLEQTSYRDHTAEKMGY